MSTASPAVTPHASTEDYLFDLRGYCVLRNALTRGQLDAINGWVDAQPPAKPGDWLGNVEAHVYSSGVNDLNYQNIVEAGPVFEELIDSPRWLPDVRRYIHPANGIVLYENFLNVRGPGGYISIHSGGHLPTIFSAFRHRTNQWMVGQINILMALSDIGPGDGATTLVSGSHKSDLVHPVLLDSTDQFNIYRDGDPAANADGMVEVHLHAGDAVLFTDGICHGSAARTNPGQRRVMIYRYAPSHLQPRLNYEPSPAFLARLSPEQRKIVLPNPRRRPPTRP